MAFRTNRDITPYESYWAISDAVNDSDARNSVSAAHYTADTYTEVLGVTDNPQHGTEAQTTGRGRWGQSQASVVKAQPGEQERTINMDLLGTEYNAWAGRKDKNYRFRWREMDSATVAEKSRSGSLGATDEHDDFYATYRVIDVVRGTTTPEGYIQTAIRFGLINSLELAQTTT